MKRFSSLSALVFLAVAVTSCGPGIDKTVTPLPKPLSPELHAAALQQGKAIVAETFSLLSSNLQSAIQSGGVSNALPFCSVAAVPLTTSLAGKHGVTIRRVTHKPRNPANRADIVESAMLEHFRANREGTNAPAPVVTNFTTATVAFLAPIILNNELCLKCHGESGKDITPEHLAIIRQLYPRDQATGFQLGDLRGAWRVEIPIHQLKSN